MFARLLKHQLKSTYITFNILYGIIILLGLLLGVSIKIPALFTIFLILFSFAILAIIIFYIMAMFKICSTSLYGKRGYLTFSIPASPHQLILSKVIAIFLYGLGLSLSFIIAFYLIFFITSPENAFNIFGELGRIISSIFANPTSILISTVDYIVSFFSGLMLIFFSFALANSKSTTKNRTGFAVIIYIGLSILISLLKSFNILDFNICINSIENNKLAILTIKQLYASSNYNLLLSINDFIIDLFSAIGLYFSTVYLMTNKLELE